MYGIWDEDTNSWVDDCVNQPYEQCINYAVDDLLRLKGDLSDVDVLRLLGQNHFEIRPMNSIDEPVVKEDDDTN
jgi:hypothetical protein